jgi:peptide/nickel transport system substrate-binding protein
MTSKKHLILIALIVMVGILLAACQPQEVVREVEVIVTQEVEKIVTQEVEVEKEVIVTQEVEKEVVVTVEVEAMAPETKEVIIALYQEPQILNPFIATQTASGEVYSGMIEGLVETDAAGNYYAVLAKEIPTVANGGVVLENDVLVVTYNLLEGVLWSTGQPFTCDDVLFTWEAVTHPDSGAVSTSNFVNITSVECPDDLTAVVTYEPFFAPYIETFESILPRHATGPPEEMQKWIYNWSPVGTGPFRMQEWVPGDHLTMVKSENFRDYPAKPYLDKVVIRMTPSREVGMAMIQTGEVDFLWDLIEGVVPDLEGKPGVVLNITAGLGTERLVLNLSDPALDATDDPVNNPHPLLGDVRVRKGIEAAINKEEINEILLFGAATVGTKEYNIGWPSEGCDVPASTYDPSAAMAFLDDAGFTDDDGDGVRECNGCLYANAGDPLRLKIQTTTGNKLREQAEQLLIEYMAEVGIDMYIENVPSSVLFASWASGAFRKHGQYDVLMYTTSGGTDPHSQLNGYFGTDKMPTEANSGTGFNYSRWVNPADDQLKQAGLSPDIDVRRDLYCETMLAIGDELPHIYLYDRAEIHATREGLTGYEPNPWQYQTWDIGEWDWEGG